EAMKMEHTIAAPSDGVVSEVHYQAGDLVEEGADLLEFESASEA
ncbi:MAG: acetyl-CoA carboxylase biotin carboxyl carrier protein subunit, partial [Alphaproteobacteria bacterium]|nr:acetyl-CoA carboxylase biotin carboxyl carrier protein subunit [Alphaproteobacteria bacterium]